MGETNGSHRGIFSMRSTVATPPSLLPRGRTKTARYIAGFLAALMAVVAMALASASGTELAEAQTYPSTDRVALVALYNATDGPNWSNETNWLSAEPMGEWHGVTTDGSGRVTALDLDENELNGKMPVELGNLTNLQRLYLNDNSGLSGPLPGSFTGLTSLTHLDLSGTGVCAPTDTSFQAWLESIATRLGVVNCREQTTGDPLIDRYDTNNNDTIEKSEVIAAINDYLFGEEDEAISKAEVIGLINLYLFGPSTPHNAPGAPGGLTAAGNGQTRIDLSWSAPPSDGGTAITGYRIEVSEDRSTWTDLVANTGNAATSYSHTGLTAGTTRHYQVSAINSAGMGPASNIATGNTDTSSAAPDLVVDTPTLSDSSPMTDQALTLSLTVRNRGAGPSGPTTLTYYRSDDSTITPADTEVGTDGVAGLGASESSAESTLTYAPSTLGTYYYGVCVDSMPGESDTTNNCSDAVAVTVSQFDIDSLPWVADGITSDERRVMEHIRDLATIDRSMSQRVAGSPWLSNGVTEDELRMLADLRDLAGVHPEIAVLVTTVPDQTGRLIEAVLYSLQRILSRDPGRSEQFLGQSWFQDGLTEDEAALIVALRSAANSADWMITNEDIFRDLLQGGHVRSDTISLPLAGEVDLFAVARSELWLEGTLERMAFAAEALEAFMGTPWPQPDVIVHLELESDLGAAGWNRGTHVMVKNTSKILTYHELAHFYFRGHNVPQWLSEGSATFLALHALRLTGDAGSISSKYIQDQIDILEECAPHGWTNVQEFVEAEEWGACTYLLGRQFLAGMYRTLGHEVVSSALRELFETGEGTGRIATEDEIYRAFLANTPSSQRNDFRLWYHCLHGRPIPGYTAAPKAAPSPEIRDALAALYNATNGPGWKNSENWLTEAPLGEWHGVVTDCDGSVIGLRLVENQLTGPIPQELGNLSELLQLDLGRNQLTGPIPPELARLTNLALLNLGGNQLTGPIPPELGSLSNLGVLHLGGNQLTGPIPPELGSLTNLWRLGLGSNRLTGPIPPELGNLSHLLILWLYGNQLTGPIPPELGNLSALEYLFLQGNQLTGCVPASLKAIENNDIDGLGLEVCTDS